jgi:DNA polymerase III epsilon subunit-like protein
MESPSYVSSNFRKVLIFDVETTGLLPKTKPTEIGEYPHILQLSFIVYNMIDNNIEKTYNAYIKVDPAVEIYENITELTGITREICDTYGVSIVDALDNLYRAYMNCDCIIAHNLSFDSEMVRIEIERNREIMSKKYASYNCMFNKQSDALFGIESFCTTMSSINICNIYVDTISKKNKTYKYKKFPKLIETYTFLFNETPQNLHNSLVDAMVCLRCFLKIKYRKDIPSYRFSHWIKSAMNDSKNIMV